MAKRWTKQKAGKQTRKKRKKAPTGTGSTASASGTMGGFRRGLKALTGERWVDRLIWVAVAVIAAVAVYRKCG